MIFKINAFLRNENTFVVTGEYTGKERFSEGDILTEDKYKGHLIKIKTIITNDNMILDFTGNDPKWIDSIAIRLEGLYLFKK